MDDVSQYSDGSLSLRLARVGAVTIAVRNNEIHDLVNWIDPAPLPFASPSVLGVVSVQGRMFTVLDTAKLLDVTHQNQGSILALRGPEQLALSIDEAGELFQTGTTEIRPPAEFVSISEGTIDRDGVTVHLVATQKLFVASLQGRERRRRRF